MVAKNEIEKIENDVELIESVFSKLVNELQSFEVGSEAALPYGLKPHTRSVSWLVEQVLVQKAKSFSEELGLSDVNYELPDTELHDLEITIGERTYNINVKCHQAEKKANKNDISAVVKLYNRYQEQPQYDLIYVAVGIKFDNRSVVFMPEHVHCFSPQFLPIYVNPTNDKIQAFYSHVPEKRSRREFLALLRQSSRSLKL
jgi:hypothetical protein